ncbi:hypothetical protein DM02DRAFT_610974 [Periconia macrospinosa]|uniref:Uncharacterized protein n=1 Tax=Periconia macrospinosa TaxID=97972 RepID=A0A2V1E778_9PLEO|nr:hypothetical protein DM02DRAFT_610974 [Periconia macrospinosa]
MLLTTIAPLILLVAKASAAGCKGSMTYGFCEPDRIVRYYDPEDGQICNMRDCGGGRAPPKTTDPCCGAYKGTETCNPTPSPSYLPCFSQLKATSAGSKPTSSGSGPAVTTTPSRSVNSSPAMTSPGGSSSPASTTSGSDSPQTTSGSDSPQTTNAPVTSNGTATTGGVLSAPAASSPQSSSSAPAQASNAAYALRYDLLGAFAGFIGVNAMALA